jgi:hypothetical protein
MFWAKLNMFLFVVVFLTIEMKVPNYIDIPLKVMLVISAIMQMFDDKV